MQCRPLWYSYKNTQASAGGIHSQPWVGKADFGDARCLKLLSHLLSLCCMPDFHSHYDIVTCDFCHLPWYHWRLYVPQVQVIPPSPSTVACATMLGRLVKPQVTQVDIILREYGTCL